MIPEPYSMTEKELQKLPGIPEAYKAAIEHAIYEMALPDDPADKVWPDYFRGEVVETEKAFVLNEWDKVEEDHYCQYAGWFQAGWKARGKAVEVMSMFDKAINELR